MAGLENLSTLRSHNTPSTEEMTERFGKRLKEINTCRVKESDSFAARTDLSSSTLSYKYFCNKINQAENVTPENEKYLSKSYIENMKTTGNRSQQAKVSLAFFTRFVFMV